MFKDKFTYVVKEYSALYKINEETIEERVIGIGIKDTNTNIVYPSLLTNYIRKKFKTKKRHSLSSQRNAAYELIKFLKYLREQITRGDEDFIDLRDGGLFELKLLHGSRYISNLSLKTKSGEIAPNYVYRIEKYLIKFYEWLSENSILSEPFFIDDDSPFNDINLDTEYPNEDDLVSEDKLKDFGENRYELVLKFIKIAQDVVPEIALGICFQFFGGLRVGEIVNLTKASIEYPYYWDDKNNGEQKFILKIRNRNKQLFKNKRNLQHEQVKVPRDQPLMVNPDLSRVYKEHKSLLKRMENRQDSLNKDALFVSKITGNPISGKTYKEKFEIVKSLFLKQLSDEGRTEDYKDLTDKRWSTHIGRGVFTNFLLEVTDNVTLVANARGDKYINTVMAYVEENNAIKLTTEAINNIRKAYEDKKATIDQSIIDKFKSKVIEKR
jgi:integrase